MASPDIVHGTNQSCCILKKKMWYKIVQFKTTINGGRGCKEINVHSKTCIYHHKHSKKTSTFFLSVSLHYKPQHLHWKSLKNWKERKTIFADFRSSTSLEKGNLLVAYKKTNPSCFEDVVHKKIWVSLKDVFSLFHFLNLPPF